MVGAGSFTPTRFLPEPWGCVHDQGSVKIKAARENYVLSSICFSWLLPILCTMAFMLTHVYGEEQTGICKLVDPAIIWDVSLIVNLEAIGLCPSTEQLFLHLMNICIPHGHINAENLSPELLGPPIPSRANVKVVMAVLAIFGVGIAGWMCKRWPAFTEADINMGLMSEPAVPRRSDSTFEIHPSF